MASAPGSATAAGNKATPTPVGINNYTTSIFFRLPPEIRVMVYAEVCRDGIRCHDQDGVAFPTAIRSTAVRYFWECEDPAPHPPAPAHALSLIFTCRQLRKEALPHVFKTLTFCHHPKHRETLRRLPDLNIKAVYSIRHMNFNIICHAANTYCPDWTMSTILHWHGHTDPPEDSPTWARSPKHGEMLRWDHTLNRLVKRHRLLLDSLSVHMECYHARCRLRLHRNPFATSLLKVEKSCKKITYTGDGEWVSEFSLTMDKKRRTVSADYPTIGVPVIVLTYQILKSTPAI